MTTTPLSPPVLPLQNWQPDVHARLTKLIEHHAAAAHATKQAEQPLAVFDFDNTCILNDIGELFSHFLIDEMLYRYDLNEFWDLIHPDDGRDTLYNVTESALQIPAEHRSTSMDYGHYLYEMGALYGRRLARAGKADCYQWAVRLHVGMTEQQIHNYSKQAIRRELSRVVERQNRYNPVLDTQAPVSIGRGIRMFQEIYTLIQTLKANNFDVWIVSATNIWTVRSFAKIFQITPDRVLGNSLLAGPDNILTSETIPPVLFRQGKVEAIQKYIGRTPVLAFGDSDTDLEMLVNATDLSVVIDVGNTELHAAAQKHGWAIQPQSTLTLLDSTSLLQGFTL